MKPEHKAMARTSVSEGALFSVGSVAALEAGTADIMAGLEEIQIQGASYHSRP